MGKSTKNLPVYVIAGSDVHLRTQAIGQLREQLLGKDQGLGEIRLDGKTADLPTVLDELRTMPFLSECKVVIVDDADKFITDNREALEEYLGEPSPTGVLVLIADSWRKATRLDKQINQIGKIVPAESLKGQSLVHWLVQQARDLGKDLSPAAADELVKVIGTESGRLANELEKLSLYVGTRRQITLADIEALSGYTAEENVFQLMDLIAEGKTAEALAMLGLILENDRSAEYSMVGVMTFSLRRLLKAKMMIESGMPVRQALAGCKVYPGIAARIEAQLKRFTASQLKNLVEQLTHVDYANKTGLGQAQLNLERFIVCATTNP